MVATGQFEVPGTLEGGVEFPNNQPGQISYTFTATGTWTPNFNNPSLSGCTAAGIHSYPPAVQEGIKNTAPQLAQYMKYPKNTPFALLAVNKATGDVVTELGKPATITLRAGEKLVFVLNDMWGGYADNKGGITVNWSADIPAPPPDNSQQRNQEIQACQSIINELRNYKQRYWAIGLNGDTLQPDGFVAFFNARKLPFEYFVRSRGVSMGDSSAYDKNIATLENYIKRL